MEAPDFPTCYDFSVIEDAVESLAATANPDVAWLTPADAVALQKQRPRIECYLEPGSVFGSPPHYVITAQDMQRRVNGWQGSLRTRIITPVVSGASVEEIAADPTKQSPGQNSYKLHSQYRSLVTNLLATVDQQLKDDHKLLPFHQVARCWDAGSSPRIAPQENIYESLLTHNLIYSIRPNSFPGGIYTGTQPQPAQPIPVEVADGALLPLVDSTGAFIKYAFRDQKTGQIVYLSIVDSQLQVSNQ